MKYKFLLYGLIAATISSCSSAYKASQTPDDVYFSPAFAHKEAAVATDKNDKYEDYVSSADDQYLRMKIRDRERWSTIDDYSYWNDSRYISYNNYNYDYFRSNVYYNPYSWNNWNSPYYNFYYNPYYVGGYNMSGYFFPQYSYGYGGYNPYGVTYVVKNPTRVQSGVNRPNLNSYRNGMFDNRNYNTNQGLGNTLRRVFTPNNNFSSYSNRNSSSNTNSYSAPQRSYTPSSSGGSSSGSSSGGVSRPPR